MTTGGYDPNQDPKNPGGYPPPGNYPPPSGGGTPPPGGYPPPGNYPPPGGYPPPGSYPPPGGNYPPPGGDYPPGSYPPPPSGGNYPPPPGAYDTGGFGGPSTNRFGVGDAISYGWSKFSANAGVWIVFMLIAFVVQGLINGIFNGFDFTTETTDFTVLSGVGSIVSAIVGYLIQAAFVRGALSEVDGHKPAFGTFLQIGPIGAVIVAGLLVGIGTFVGLLLCIIPGLVFAFFAWWTMQFVIDRNQDAITAIKSSFTAVRSNAGTLFLLALALLGINIVGLLLCLVGLLVTVPVSIIAVTYAYRVTTGGPVAA